MVLRVEAARSRRVNNGGKYWRDNLHTVFISHLSKRVSWDSLKRIFDQYGKVLDVFIPNLNSGRFRFSAYAFVRYKFAHEMNRAIELGNNLRIDGLIIGVKKAIFGWKDRSSKPSRFSGITKPSSSKQAWLAKERDARSFKDALVGSMVEHQNPKGKKAVVINSAPVSKDGCSSSTNHGLEKASLPILEDSFNLFIPDSDMDWLHCCAIGRLVDNVKISDSSAHLQQLRSPCKVCVLETCSILLKFPDVPEMNCFIASSNVWSIWFHDLSPWRPSVHNREVAVWVNLENVPLHLCHNNIF